ncbi:MAG: hypothetical protein ACRELD_12090 [Longimicrobiales bacterium]
MPALRRLRLAVLASALLLAPQPASPQASMRDVLNQLFVFTGGSDPLFLGGSAGLPGTAVHGDHFIPSESEANGAVLAFFNNAITSNIANFPLSSTVSSQTFVFTGGVPTPTSSSFGPIFAERAPTLGRGRFNAGFSYSRLSFARMRGIPISDLKLRFVHQNVDFPNCDEIFGGDCTELGLPLVEHDVIELDLDLGIEAQLYAFYATVGLADWLDVSLAVPVVRFRFDGTSTAQIVPGGDQTLHFFGGTPEDPILSATTRASDETTGIGDITTRLKARFVRSDVLDVALLAELRAPTGREENFLGTGEVGGRGLLIASGTFGDFSPHLNAGYTYRGRDIDQDAVEIIAGFDHRLSEWATLAVDLLTAFRIDGEGVDFPEAVEIEVPYRRVVERTNIPNIRDNIVDGSIGMKFRTGAGVVLIANALVALNDGGLRARIVPTFGIEYGR